MSSIILKKGVAPSTPSAGDEGFYIKTDGTVAHISDTGVIKTLSDSVTKTVAPTVTDDSDAGYGVGLIWVDTTASKSYICQDSTVGAAVWIEITVTNNILPISVTLT